MHPIEILYEKKESPEMQKNLSMVNLEDRKLNKLLICSNALLSTEIREITNTDLFNKIINHDNNLAGLFLMRLFANIPVQYLCTSLKGGLDTSSMTDEKQLLFYLDAMNSYKDELNKAYHRGRNYFTC